MLGSRSTPKVGILGGGQLARMLVEAAHPLSLATTVLTTDPRDPAARVGGAVVYGALDDEATLRAFFGENDVITFESEFHPADRLARAAAGLGIDFLPSLAALSVMQDKLQQKALLARVGVASAPYRVLGADDDWRDWLAACFAQLGPQLVLKWSRLGYDGKGTLFVDDSPAARQRVAPFVAAAEAREAQVYAEQRIDFRHELALVAVHAPDGCFVSYPLVVSEQQAGICKRVYGPAVRLGVAPAMQRIAEGYARVVAEALPLHGAFALELFETSGGELLVNEMAPRVHNSGHFTLDASGCSQFENHLRAIAGLPLAPAVTEQPFAMLNLLSDLERADPPCPEVRAPFVLHWYEKAEARPGRKMGHINVVADDEAALWRRLDELDAIDARWLAALEGAAEDGEKR